MLNLAKYAAVAAVAVGFAVAATEPASAWDQGYGYGYGPHADGFAYPYYGSYGYQHGYRPSYRHRFHTYNGHRTFYPAGTGG
jgi:hypothetical protein